MKRTFILLYTLGLLIIGIVFLGVKYFDAVLLVNDMQIGVEYRDSQIETLRALFLTAGIETSRTKITENIDDSFEDGIIKKFDDRIEVNEIVILFNKENVVNILTLNEYSIWAQNQREQ